MRGYDKSDSKSTEKSVGSWRFGDNLDELAREGACRMLKAALEQEVKEFLGRGYYERQEVFTGYRNGYGKRRKVALGSGTVELRAPRVRATDRPFQSRVLRSYQRQSAGVKRLIPELYLHGLATGDFELAMRGLLGDGASLSAASVCRLKEQWAAEYESWRKRSLKGHSYVYLWCDGIYPKAGLAEDKTALLVVLAAREDGTKEVVSIYEGYRESTESWLAVLRDLKARGLSDPRLFIGDGALGLWAAIREVYPQANEQRCWVHKMRNVLNCFPKRLQGEVKIRLREIYYAATRDQAEKLMKALAGDYGRDYPRGIECLLKNQAQLLTYFDYPQAHWQSLKTTNPIESIFSPVKLRTNAARRIKSPRSALYLIYALIIRAQKRWRKINAPELIEDVIAGVKFENGIKIKSKKHKRAAA
jgi:putative transposase